MLQQFFNDPISFNEVKLAISKLNNNNKAKGADEISFEILKYSGKKTIKRSIKNIEFNSRK